MPLPHPPHRAAFFAPLLTLPDDVDRIEGVAALLLHMTVLEHFLRHPEIAIAQDELRIADDDSSLLNPRHPDFESRKTAQFELNRRDDVLWLELSLDPARPGPATLHVETPDGETLHTASGASLHEAIARCLSGWLAARELSEAPAPLPPFSAETLLAEAARLHEVLRAAQLDGAEPDFSPPPTLPLPALRLLNVSLGLAQVDEMLELDPEHPWALNLLAEDTDDLACVLAAAPNWGRPYYEGVELPGVYMPDDEDEDPAETERKLRWTSAAAFLMPDRDDVLAAYAQVLESAGREDEAVRIAGQALERDAANLDALYIAISADRRRPAAQVRDADERLAAIAELIAERPFDPSVCHARLVHADAHLYVGRLEHALSLRRRALEEVGADPERWPAQTAVTHAWENDPDVLSMAFGRDAWYRGEPGRAVEVWSRRLPDESRDVELFLRALIATQREELAPLAFAHYGAAGLTFDPGVRLAAALAFLATGQLARALELREEVHLQHPRGCYEIEVHRLLRLAAAAPAAEWEALVRERTAQGAHHLAALLARDAADFVPGLAESTVLRAALGAAAAVPFDRGWVEELRDLLMRIGVAGIDALFERFHEPSLAHADGLVNAWWAALDADPLPTDDEEREIARTLRMLYVAGQTLCRYLALCTQAPNVFAGGLRQVLGETLAALRTRGHLCATRAVQALLRALDRAARATRVSDGLLDPWLLRLEQALGLEEWHGSLECLAQRCERVGALLRGPERVAFELRGALELRERGDDPATCCALFERSVRALGIPAALEWSEAAARALSPEEALDVHHTAARILDDEGAIQLRLSKALFAAGHPQAAFAHAIPAVYDSDDLDADLAVLRPLWKQGKIDVPFDAEKAAEKGATLVEKGRTEEAIRCLRWGISQIEEDEEAWRALGIAQARAGDLAESVAAFCESDGALGLKLAGHCATEAKAWDRALAAYAYAYLYGADHDDWLRYGLCAWWAQNDAAMAEAYGNADRLAAGRLSGANLNLWGHALAALGRIDEASAVAERLQQVKKKEPQLAASALGLEARVALARGDRARAESLAQQAARLTPDEADRQEFEETARRARAGDPWPTKGPVMEALHHLGKSEAAEILAATTGATERDALLCRIEALRTREALHFPLDPPPPLDAPMSLEAFERELARRTATKKKGKKR